MSKWIRVITFTLPHEAHIAKSVLETEGINTIIQNDLTAQVHNFYSNAIGGVHLTVCFDDAEKAYSILKEGGFIKETQKKKVKKVDKKNKHEICPFCGSDNIGKRDIPTYLFLIAMLILFIPLPFLRKRYFCFVCEEEWK